ncbi:hypothetical protein CDAR_464461 [Caerostris darwini]|uniref:Uncharacterized protein n=1 Tax=Caerostris darwini TaxID=1538125 RepID=A0AAV4VUH5_9ARAC|nr:hypothetical protein CDAR_464461 [Caerostris darwini]
MREILAHRSSSVKFESISGEVREASSDGMVEWTWNGTQIYDSDSSTPHQSSTHSNITSTSVKTAHVSHRPSTKLSFSVAFHVSSRTPDPSSPPNTSNLPATPGNTHYKTKNHHKKKKLPSNTTSIFTTINNKSKPLLKLNKYYDTDKLQALASFVTPNEKINLSRNTPIQQILTCWYTMPLA